ncbi:MAG: type IV secretion system protein [Fusobacterium gastrosuis]|uniref:type IV secretion system protein n=1 Tax=Fusobacterium gastrosuis TaxID=1755100 RepID=UPI002975EB49|nr:type IV secretion system protein [Fusobacteriaceae bacterium]MDY4011014.1 type IV secretion system protein [Fusobacterium gastrosuis]MDY5713534.1 type IV secretion system protein [Fusobacterium gastrosuis]
MIFTEILSNFIKLLEQIPGNLRTMAYSLLFSLSTIEIALTIYNNIDNENFSYIKWGKIKILKIGFIIFAINKYEWLLNGIKSFFLEIGVRGLGVNLGRNNYFNDPSKIWDRGREISKIIWDEVTIRPSTYVFLLIGFLVLIGFFMISIQIIICWVEFYFLTGISLVFLPFGALEMTLEYYKNVFKTIMGSSIKLCVFNIWLLACDKILNSLFTTKTSYKLDDTLVICGTVYILVTVMLSMPSITTGLLTGSPTLNAGQAMSGAIAAGVGAVAGAYHTARGTFEAGKGIVQGAKTGTAGGSKFGGIIGGAVGGPVGAGLGAATIGALGGAVGGAVGGSYAGARYVATKQESTSSGSKKSKKEDESKNTSKKNSSTEDSDNSNESKSETKTEVNNRNNQNSSNTNTSTSSTATNQTQTNNTHTVNSNANSETSTSEKKVINTSSSVDTMASVNNTSSQINNTQIDSSKTTSVTRENVSTDKKTSNPNTETSSKSKTRNSLPDWAKEDY